MIRAWKDDDLEGVMSRLRQRPPMIATLVSTGTSVSLSPKMKRDSTFSARSAILGCVMGNRTGARTKRLLTN